MTKEPQNHFMQAQQQLQQAFNFFQQGQQEAALECFNKAIELNPAYVEAYSNRAVFYLHANEPEAAAADLSKAIELKPDYSDAYFYRGAAFEKLGQLHAALKDYDTAIALNPADAKSHNNKGTIKHKLEQYNDALESFNKVIELNPDDISAYNNRSIVLIDMLVGNTQKNISEIKKHEFITDLVKALNKKKDHQFSNNNELGHIPTLRETSPDNTIKLHLASGTAYKDGWINIDNNSYNNIKKLDLNWDLRIPLPFPDNSVDYIFNEHFFEHLTVEEGLSSMKDFLRVLKPGGFMRIAMPDLEVTVRRYFDENWKENNRAIFEKLGLTFIQTRAELINIGFRWWGHQWLYDWEELERRLKEAGGKKIKRCYIFESEHEELKNLETRDESILIAEVTK